MKASNICIELESKGIPTFFDITEDVKKFISDANGKNGQVLIFTPHTTCSVFLQEASHDTMPDGTEFMMADMIEGFEKIFPVYAEGAYRHPGPQHVAIAETYDKYPEWLNTDAHFHSAMLGRSETIPLVEGELILGRFASVYFADFDQTRKRKRKVYVQALLAD